MPTYQPTCLRFCLSLSFALLFTITGFTGAVTFALWKQYINYHCAGWACVSGALALALLVLHVVVKKDVAHAMRPTTFNWFVGLGDFGTVLGLAVFVGYLVKGIVSKEEGMDVHGWYIVMVWGWMTLKSGFLLAYFGRKYRKALLEVTGGILAVDPLLHPEA